MNVTINKSLNIKKYDKAIINLHCLKKKLVLENGIIAVQYRTDGTNPTNYNRPKISIREGCWCPECEVRNVDGGGVTHREDCEDPREDFLQLTWKGLLELIKTTANKKGVELMNEIETRTYTSHNLRLLYNIKKVGKYYTIDTEGITGFKLSDFLSKKGHKKTKNIEKTAAQRSFKNALHLTLEFKEGNDVYRPTARIWPTGQIELFRCPLKLISIEEKIIESIKTAKCWTDYYKNHGYRFKLDKSKNKVTSLNYFVQIKENIEIVFEKFLPELNSSIKQRKVGSNVGIILEDIITERESKGALSYTEIFPSLYLQAKIQIFRWGSIQIDISLCKFPKFCDSREVLGDIVIKGMTMVKNITEFHQNLLKNNSSVYKNVEPNVELEWNTFTGTAPPVCRKTQGVINQGRRPIPYSFRGKCESWVQYQPPWGDIYDENMKYYPCCSKLTKKAMIEYRDFLLNGFPRLGNEVNDITQYGLIKNRGKPDTGSGIFPPNSMKVGNKSLIFLPGYNKPVKVTVTYVSKDRKLLNVMYEGKVYNNIKRTKLLPEDRRSDGLIKMLEKKEISFENIITLLRNVGRITVGKKFQITSLTDKNSGVVEYLTSQNYKLLMNKKVQTYVIQTDKFISHGENKSVPVSWVIDKTELIIKNGIKSMKVKITGGGEKGDGFGVYSYNKNILTIFGRKRSVKSDEIGIRYVNSHDSIIDYLYTLTTDGDSFDNYIVGFIHSGKMLVWHYSNNQYSMVVPVQIIDVKVNGKANKYSLGWDNKSFGLEFSKEVYITNNIGTLKKDKYYLLNAHFVKNTKIDNKLDNHRPFSVVKEIDKKMYHRTLAYNSLLYVKEYPVFNHEFDDNGNRNWIRPDGKGGLDRLTSI